MSTSTVPPAGSWINVGAIERELTALWQQASEDEDHGDPKQECDRQEDLLERRGPADSEDAPHRMHVDPSAGKMEFQTMLSPDEDCDQGNGPDDVRD